METFSQKTMAMLWFVSQEKSSGLKISNQILVGYANGPGYKAKINETGACGRELPSEWEEEWKGAQTDPKQFRSRLDFLNKFHYFKIKFELVKQLGRLRFGRIQSRIREKMFQCMLKDPG